MYARRIRLIIFSVLTILGTFLPWVSAKGLGISSGASGGIILFFVGLMAAIIALAVLGNKEEDLNKNKKIGVAIIGGLSTLLSLKYIFDASTSFTSPSIGLFLMFISSALIVAINFIPNNIIPCYAANIVNKILKK